MSPPFVVNEPSARHGGHPPLAGAARGLTQINRDSAEALFKPLKDGDHSRLALGTDRQAPVNKSMLDFSQFDIAF